MGDDDEKEGNPIFTFIGSGVALFFGWFLFLKCCSPAKEPANIALEKAFKAKTDELNFVKKLTNLQLEAVLLDTVWESKKLSSSISSIEFENVNYLPSQGTTVLIALARSKDYPFTDSSIYMEAFKNIKKHKADLNLTDKYGRTALVWNTIEGINQERIFTRISNRKKKFSSSGDTNRIRLIFGPDQSTFHLDFQKFLLQNYAAADIPDNGGNTALMLACYLKSVSYAKLLLSYGAKPKLRNKKGYTAFDMAGNNSEITALLNQYSQ